MTIFAWEDYVKDGTMDTAGTTEITPVENLQDRRLAKDFQCTYTSPTLVQIKSNWNQLSGNAAPVKIVALIGVSITSPTPGALPDIILRLYSGANQGGTELHTDSYGLNEWVPPTDSMQGIVVFEVPDGISALSMRVDISGASDPLDISIGRLWAGPALIPSKQMDAFWKLRLLDRSRVTRSRGEQVYADEKPRVKQFMMSLSDLSKLEAIGTVDDPDSPSFLRMGMEAGTSGEVLVIPSTRDAHEIHTLGVYGTMPTGIEIVHSGEDRYSVDMTVLEAR